MKAMHPDLIIQKHGLSRTELVNGRKIWIVECRMEMVVRSGLRSRTLEREWKISHASAYHLRNRWEKRKHFPRYKHWILFSNLLADFAAEIEVSDCELIGVLDRSAPIRFDWREQLIKRANRYGFALSEIARGISIDEFTVQHYLQRSS